MIRTSIKKGKTVMIRTKTKYKRILEPAPPGSDKKLPIFGSYDWARIKKG